MKVSPVLGLFAKSPQAGAVKTRLIPVLGEDGATELYTRLLTRSLKIAGQVSGADKIIFAAGQNDLEYFRARTRWRTVAQCGDNLGQRMAHAFARFSGDNRALILFGADVCDFTPADLSQALQALGAGVDVVLGPSYDGGYWLVASSKPNLPIFTGIDWSTGRVFSQTRQRLIATGLSYFCLPVRHDVDVAADLTRFTL